MRTRDLAPVLLAFLFTSASCAGVSTDCTAGCADAHTVSVCTSGPLGTVSASHEPCPPQANECVFYAGGPTCAMSAQPVPECTQSTSLCITYQGQLAQCLDGYPVPTDDLTACEEACENWQAGNCLEGGAGD